MYKYIKQGNIYKLYNNNTPVQVDKELIAFKSLYNAKKIDGIPGIYDSYNVYVYIPAETTGQDFHFIIDVVKINAEGMAAGELQDFAQQPPEVLAMIDKKTLRRLKGMYNSIMYWYGDLWQVDCFKVDAKTDKITKF